MDVREDILLAILKAIDQVQNKANDPDGVDRLKKGEKLRAIVVGESGYRVLVDVRCEKHPIPQRNAEVSGIKVPVYGGE